MTVKPKLIEVALPLAAINAAAAAEGSVGQRPHPKNLHRWWARRPLAAARAVLWASLIDDPSGDPALSAEDVELERKRLFGILERLVVWENSNNQHVLGEARAEIDRCFPEGPPPIVDPFGGGGAISLEAQRLGLTALSGDLNPVAVLIQRAMLEIPPRFAGRPPVHPDLQPGLDSWVRAQGLAADVEAYGKWMREEADRQIGHLYPDATGPHGEKLTPLAWIWARTVESPDPSWKGHVPLVASWTLAKKPGKPTVWIEPIIDSKNQTIRYEVRQGGEPRYERTVDRGHGTCIATGAAISLADVDTAAKEGALSASMMALIADSHLGRIYCPVDDRQERAAALKIAADLPADLRQRTRGTFAGNAQGRFYGMYEFSDYFTPRQLTALTTFSDLLGPLHARAAADARRAGFAADGARLRDGGCGATAYADAIVTYLAFAIDKLADFSNSLCSWNAQNAQLRYMFSRQGIAMTWDFAEINPLGDMSGWQSQLTGIVRTIRDCLTSSSESVRVAQLDAQAMVRSAPRNMSVSTDPPYYDNISYADLSDFFYVWLRRNLKDVWPDECATLLTPKAEELIANQYRAGSKAKAEAHFESGMAEFMKQVAGSQRSDVPATIYYAYKATESKDGELRSTGWDTFLQAVIDAGMQVTATWPLRTERQGRMVAIGTNALASSIVLACRPRPAGTALASRGEFVAALRAELPEAVRVLQSGDIAPVDIPQSTIGPGIGVFSRFAKVVESDGSAMRVSAALSIINDVLGQILDGEESEMDADSRFALAWYAHYGYNPASSGEADSVARAKNTALRGVEDAGIGESRDGKFRLFERSELPADWSPTGDTRLTVWEATQQLIAALERSESEAAALRRQLGGYAERAHTLAYVLFKRATDKSWAKEAGDYNALIAAWPALRASEDPATPGQQSMFE